MHHSFLFNMFIFQIKITPIHRVPLVLLLDLSEKLQKIDGCCMNVFFAAALADMVMINPRTPETLLQMQGGISQTDDKIIEANNSNLHLSNHSHHPSRATTLQTTQRLVCVCGEFHLIVHIYQSSIYFSASFVFVVCVHHHYLFEVIPDMIPT